VMLSLRIRLVGPGRGAPGRPWDLHGELLVEDFLGKFFAFGFDPFVASGGIRLMHLRTTGPRACR